MSRGLEHQRSGRDVGGTADHDVDYDAEHDAEVSRRASVAGLRREEAGADQDPADQVSAPPYLEIAPSSITMGAIKLGEEAGALVYLHNHEDRDLWIAELDVTEGHGYRAQLLGVNRIAPGAVATALITFAPRRDGKDAGQVRVKTSEGFAFWIEVHGVGVLPAPGIVASDEPAPQPSPADPDAPEPVGPTLPTLAFRPESAEFGAIEIGRRARQIYTVTNEGAETVAIQDLVVRDNPAFLVELPGTGVLDPGAAATFALTFAPFEEGRTTASVVLTAPDGTGLTFHAGGGGVAARVAAPEPAAPAVGPVVDPWAPSAPAPEPEVRLEQPLAVSPPGLDMATVAGRHTLPTQVRIENPNQRGVAVEASIDSHDGKPSPFSVDDRSIWAPSRDEGSAAVAVTYAPGAEGSHRATLRLRYQDREETIKLTGTAMAAARASGEDAGGDAANQRPTVSELPSAAAPRNQGEQDAMIAAAAEALSGLAPAYQANLPPMRIAAEQLVGQTGDAVADFGASLLRWLSDEGSQALESLRASGDMNFLSYALSIATAGTTSGGLIGDTVFLAIGMDEAATTNRQIDKAVGNNDFLSEMMARHSGGYTRLVVNQTAEQIGRLGEADGELKQIAGQRAMEQILELSRYEPAGVAASVERNYRRANDLISEYKSWEKRAADDLRAIAASRNQITAELQRALPLLMDKYLEFRALGGQAKRGDQTLRVLTSGNVNFDHPPPAGTPPFTVTLYPDALRFKSSVDANVTVPIVGPVDIVRPARLDVASVGYADMSSPMRSHVSSKRLGELTSGGTGPGEIRAVAGWEVEIALASAQGGELRMSQAADGSRSAQVSSEAQVDVDRAGGIAAVWAELDRHTL